MPTLDSTLSPIYGAWARTRVGPTTTAVKSRGSSPSFSARCCCDRGFAAAVMQFASVLLAVPEHAALRNTSSVLSSRYSFSILLASYRLPTHVEKNSRNGELHAAMPGLLLRWVPADRTCSYVSGGWFSELSEGFKLEPSITCRRTMSQLNVRGDAARTWEVSTSSCECMVTQQ